MNFQNVYFHGIAHSAVIEIDIEQELQSDMKKGLTERLIDK